MVGLSIVLEEHHHHHHHHHQQQQEEEAEPHHHRRHCNTTAEVISKTKMSMVINKPSTGTGSSSSSSSNPSSPSASSYSAFRPALPVADFLDHCFLCRIKLSHGKDIYMYRGDRAFCSEECRCRQILLDEEEAFRRENQDQSHCSSSATHPSSSRNRRGTRNRASGGQ